jgi:glyceraldehyde 3-phosphate dehydrogenase
MTSRIAINGLGRIGRCVLRALFEESRWPELELVALNGPAANETHAYLTAYDSVHGRFPHPVSSDAESLTVAGKRIPVFHERDPKRLNWGDLGADIVLECTGAFTTRESAAIHLEQGARRVLVSAPADGADATIVYGVNHRTLTADHRVVSVGSCTTNALAPIAKVLHETVGIERGFMTTIHAYTGDQNNVDGSHKDPRRGRACALSMVPTSTGAAKALGLVLPELADRLDGTAIRVPTPNVSLVDLTFTSERDASINAIHDAMRAASVGPLRGVLDICDAPLVSIDFNHTTASSIFDLSGTKILGNRLVRVASWYDNEWAFSCRMLDVARLGV